MMALVGREVELKQLENFYTSKKAEFLAIYGTSIQIASAIGLLHFRISFFIMQVFLEFSDPFSCILNPFEKK